jgi:DNA polymerase III epsilon subunit-like protein
VKDLILNEAIAMKLVAIDFETADQSADSACAIGIVSIEKGKITKKGYRLIRPPRGISFSLISTAFHEPTWRLSQPSVKCGISFYLFG